MWRYHTFVAAMASSHLILVVSLLAFYAFPCTASLLDPVDFLALQAIRKSLEDMPGSTFFSTWDFTSDPCAFSGVLCSGDRVIALALGDPRAGSPGLIGHLDSAIGRLSELEELSLAPGRVMGSIPRTIARLKNLRFLGLSRNYLSGTIPPRISEMKELRTVDLSFNQITGSIPASIAAIPVLTNLMLCHNHLTGRVPPFSPDSTTLERLDLKHNNLSGDISSLPNSLRYLSLSANQLTGAIGFVSNLNQLNYLDLSMDQFSGTIPTPVFSLPVSSLQLQRNIFSGPVVPTEAMVIGTVDLSFNRLTGIISPLFSSVQSLYLNNNKFTGQVPESLVERLMDSRIQTLYLQHNFLTGMEINPTAELPMSTALCLQYNCMVPPLQTPCPVKAGTQKTRPTDQCVVWRRG